MSSRRPPIETMKAVSLRKVWNSWALFDSDGHWVWGGKEDMLRRQYGKTCRVCVTGSSTTSTKRLLQDSKAKSLERTMDLSDVRMEKVIRIRTALASGCYQVSSADLAQKLITNMLGGLR